MSIHRKGWWCSAARDGPVVGVGTRICDQRHEEEKETDCNNRLGCNWGVAGSCFALPAQNQTDVDFVGEGADSASGANAAAAAVDRC